MSVLNVLKSVSRISTCPGRKYRLVVHYYLLICTQVPGNSSEVVQQLGVLGHIPDMTMMATKNEAHTHTNIIYINMKKCNKIIKLIKIQLIYKVK